MGSDKFYGIICADSDKYLDFLIDSGIQYDLVLTDPPYNINKNFGNKSDCLPIDEFVRVSYDRICKLKKLLKPDGSILWFGIHKYIGYIQVAMYQAGLYYRRMNIWHYENGFSRSKKEPSTQYEPFLWYSVDQRKWTYNVDEVRVPYKSTERLKSPIHYQTADGTQKTWKPNPKGSMHGDVWNFPTLAGKRFEKERTDHPTQKPEALIMELIKAFCPMHNGIFDGTILDPFHGSGTLGVCCEKLNLQGNNIQWTGIELEQHWCDVAQKRLDEIE